MRSLFLVLALAACGSDDKPAVDAPAGNGAFGATCTTVSNTSTECTSMVCTDSFDMLGHNVCSVQCTPGNDSTCPSGSTGMKCNAKGYCKP